MFRSRLTRGLAVSAVPIAAIFVVVGGASETSDPVASANDDFVQSFDTAASLNDIVFQISDGRSFPGDPKSFTGDHSLPGADGMCGGPGESRQLSSGVKPREVPTRFSDAEVEALGLAYWCPNGGNHIMTAFDTSGYAHFDFRPDETFTDVARVCWDQNITDMGGKWTEVAVVPLALFNANGQRMDYTHPDRNGSGKPGSWGLPITNGVFKGGFHGGQQSASVNQSTDRGSNHQGTTEEKGLRTQHCVNDNGDGTVTMSRGTADGGLQVDRLNGAFPAGEVVVIFSDVSYNPDKRPGHDADENTWHWDNLLISANSSAPSGGGSVTPSNEGGSSSGGGTVTPPAPDSPQPPVTPSISGEYDVVVPGRLFDSRSQGATIDGISAREGARQWGSVTEIVVAGRGGVASDVEAVSVNVTAVQPSASGFASVFSCDHSTPNASSLNFVAGRTVSNLVLTELSSDGRLCVYTEGVTDLIVDVTGSFPESAGFNALEPTRLLDSRAGGTTVDGVSAGQGTRQAGSITEVVVAGRGGVASNAGSVSLNLTAVRPSQSGFASVFSCDLSTPNASSLNFVAGRTVSNSVLTELSNDGRVCVFTSSGTDLLIDVTGEFPSGSGFTATAPGRLFDSRFNGATVDGQSVGDGTRQSGTVTEIQVAGRGGVPTNAGAVSVNVTAVRALAGGYVSVFSCDRSVPNASSLNFTAGQTVASSTLSELSGDGRVCVYVQGVTELIVDVTGAFPD